MNYYKQFAEMLGLELEQEFNLTDADGKKINYASYKITENGLCFKGTTNGAWHSESSIFLKNLLSGDYKAGLNHGSLKLANNTGTTQKRGKKEFLVIGEADLMICFFGRLGTASELRKKRQPKAKRL